MRDYKADVKSVFGMLGRLPLLRAFLRQSSVRRRLEKIPGARYLYVGMFRTHPFDSLHGLDTSGNELPRDFSADDSVLSSACAYLGSQPNVIRLALASLPSVNDATFLDLGCGKGRPLFVATEFPFKDIVGVELSPGLAGIARRNASIMAGRYPGRTAVRIAHSDAGNFPLPPGNVVLFMYHPFGEQPMKAVLDRVETALAADKNRSIHVVYYNPVLARLFDASPLLHRGFSGMLPYAAEEIGYGLDLKEDPIMIWQGGNARSLTLPAGTNHDSLKP